MKTRRETAIIFLIALQLLFLLGPKVWAQEIVDKATGKPRVNIIGGVEADAGAWPWMVALVWTDTPSVYDEHFCGGALIDSRWVLTAAGCVVGETTSSMRVVAGVHDLVNDSGQKIDIQRIIIHPNYDLTTADYDFALLELVSGSSLKTLPLFSGYPSGNIAGTLEGADGTVIGWGNTSTTGYIWPEKLQQATMPIVSNAACEISYPDPGEITNRMVCAGFEAGGEDSCTGDKGGPLMVQVGGQWVHAGIVSWGIGCGQTYGVYARTSAAASFIKQYIPDASFLPELPPGLPWLLLLTGN